MARIRSLKPEFWTDGKVVGLSFGARLLFMGMWNFARCDHGHVDDDALQLKLKILPADNVDAEALLEELIEAELIDRYEGEGRTFLHIRRFTDHQKVETRWNTRCPYCTPTNSDEVSETPSTTPEDRKVKEGKGRDRKQLRAAYTDEFEKFWSNYPTRNGAKGSKQEAFRVWHALEPPDRDIATTSLDAYARSARGYPKDAVRYLKGREWEGLVPAEIGVQPGYSNANEWTEAERGLA